VSSRIEETAGRGPLREASAGLDGALGTKSGVSDLPLGQRVFRRIAAALHHRDFRVLWLGACTSSIGTWMQSLAENWLVLTLTSSAFYLGLDSFLQQLPILLFTLIGGVVADRYDRRRTLLTSQFVQMFSACMLAILLYTGVVQIWHILALSFLTGCAQSFGGPAYQSLIPSIVGKEDLTNAIALNSIQFNIARFIGPLLAGAALAALGRWGLGESSAMAVIFSLNGLSFLVVIASLLALHVRHVPGTRAHSLTQELRIGLTYVRGEKTVLGLLVLSGLATFLGFPLTTLLPVFARDVFGQGVEGYSTMMAFSGAGAIVGALVVAWLGKHGRMGLSTLLLMTVYGALVILFAVSRALWLSHVLLFVAGACQMIVFSTLISLVQLIAPNEMRGRVMSIYLVAFRGGMPLGSLVGGYFASLISAPIVLVINGILLSTVGLGYLIKGRNIRQLGHFGSHDW
jgi:predicted MFS family arabinose efflux permease